MTQISSVGAQDTPSQVDLLVIGGGINGVGVARDAVGRGLSVALVEAGDLAGATSSYSSKLIHGGLRYLEQFEFRLVSEALAERETLLTIAPHLVWPARFVMPHVPELRPRWMIRTGLFLYDHLGRRTRLPGSSNVRLNTPPYNDGLRPEFRHGFIYSDCRADDARLVIANATDAQNRGAKILPRTKLVSAERHHSHWQVKLSDGQQIAASAIVNAAGPWVKEVLNDRLQVPSNDAVRLVRGSHLVMPKLYEGNHAFILQNDDRRVIFMIPYEGRFTLVGTTDVAETGDPAHPVATDAEAEYLCRAIGRYLAKVPRPEDAVLRFAGVRPLYDDGTGDPSAITRDYTLRLDHANDAAPVLSIFGGKLTTYRRLAEQVVDKISAYFPDKLSDENRLQESGWTGKAVLPGGDLGNLSLSEFRSILVDAYPWLDMALSLALLRRHGSRIHELLDGVHSARDLGENFGGNLTEREVHWFRTKEWATTADDILWRRSKCGLHMTAVQRAAFAQALGASH